MSDKQQDDELVDAYRRASASDAERPSAATRAAILAEAAAAARRNAPAANESRYWLRAVAGIAVLGIGVVLWRQTDYRTPEDAQLVVSAPMTQAAEGVAKAERAAVPESAADSARTDTAVMNERPTPQPFPASPAVKKPGVAVATERPPPAVDSPSPPLLAQNRSDDDELSEIMVTGTRIQAPKSERAAAAPGAAAVPPRVGGAPAGGAGAGARASDSMALLRQHFPAQYQSEAPHSVWLVLNAAGEVLQSGELAAGQRLADLAPQLARALGDRVPGPWQVQTLRNVRGQPIDLAIARLP